MTNSPVLEPGAALDPDRHLGLGLGLGLATIYYLLPTAYCLLSTAYYLLPTTYLGSPVLAVLVDPGEPRRLLAGRLRRERID